MALFLKDKKAGTLSKVSFLHYGKMGGCTDEPDVLPDGR